MAKIILFYKYVELKDPQEVAHWQKALCTMLNLKGRIIIASEGINGTLGGTDQTINAYLTVMRAHPLFDDIDFKESEGVADHFPRLRVVVKKEIVHLGIDPHQLKAWHGGTHLNPAQAHVLIDQKPDDLVILDCRNTYESRVGAFEGAVKAEITYFRDFPAYVDTHTDLFKDKKVLMYCTGGVRCERGSAYLKSKGVAKEVYQIAGGIHRYIQAFPNGFFKGKNYVFDDRIALRASSDVLAQCSLCAIAADEYHNCINASCNIQFIACSPCIVKYQDTCGQTCHHLVYVQNMPKRPMRKKIHPAEQATP